MQDEANSPSWGNGQGMSSSFDSSYHATAPRQNLDLKHNDNSFYVLANLMADMVDSHDELGWEERVTIERLLPSPEAFLEALRYRLEHTPARPTTPLHNLTLRCQSLGMDADSVQANPILAALALEPPDGASQVAFDHDLESIYTLSLHDALPI